MNKHFKLKQKLQQQQESLKMFIYLFFCPGAIMHIIHHSLGETFTLGVVRIKTMFPCKSDLICPKEQICQTSCL